ncbi:DsbC family protein [Novosphingobium sp. G106]|uniref:DsbC family protein n=1 Tax=Novosphingobium sp. G106 TaxID=2849500 RepID=UPI0020C3178C|nr:DsbC family protein [Novosphingobium sp. G106]
MAAVIAASPPAFADTPASAGQANRQVDTELTAAGEDAQRRLQQTFTSLRFEHFAPSPIKGPIYQALAGGRLLYYAPESEHLIFASVYDRSGVNLTALSEEARARQSLTKIDASKALAIGPADAPTIIEFTDPECPYCHSLDRFWSAKAAEGKAVRRLIFFVTGIHAGAAAKAEHILCSPDREAAFKAIYAGAAPAQLLTCLEGRAVLEAQTKIVGEAQIGGTPTLIAGDQVISGFRQGELEAFLVAASAKGSAKALTSAPR